MGKEDNTDYIFPIGSDIEIIKSFEEWIDFTINRYCTFNSIYPYEKKDLKQFINIRLIEDLPKIKVNYEGKSKLKTYMIAVTLNLSREFKKKNCTKSITMANDKTTSSKAFYIDDFNNIEKSIYIKAEIEQLKIAIAIFGSKSHKIKLAILVYYGLTIDKSVLFAYCKDNALTETFLPKLNKGIEINKKTTISILTQLFNDTENKTNTDEATRKWISRTLEEIVKLLNIGLSKHTKETLGVLLEMAFSNETNGDT